MFVIIKTMFIELVCAIGSFSESLVSNLKCVSVNQPCKNWPAIVNINPD